MRSFDDLFYDSDASLREVDRATHDLKRTMMDANEHEWVVLGDAATEPGGFTGAESLRQVDARLRDVTAATEAAATGILDSVARASALVEQLGLVAEAERAGVLASLDTELARVMAQLQFQDITTQQLGQIASVLADLRAGSPRQLPAPAAEAQVVQSIADRIFARDSARRTA